MQNAKGRVDILCESFFGLLIDRVSQDSGIPQISQQLRPILTKKIKRSGLKKVKIPDEVLGLGAALLMHGRVIDQRKIEEERIKENEHGNSRND